MNFIQNFVLLRIYLNQTFGFYYPKDIIKYIFSMGCYESIKISCYQSNTVAMIGDRMYIWGLFASKSLRHPHFVMLVKPDIKQIRSTSDHIIALTRSTDLWTYNYIPGAKSEDQHEPQHITNKIHRISFVQQDKIFVLGLGEDIDYIYRYVKNNPKWIEQYATNEEQFRLKTTNDVNKFLNNDKKYTRAYIIAYINKSTIVLTQCGSLQSHDIKCGASYSCCPYPDKKHLMRILLKNVKKFKYGSHHIVALTFDHRIYTWGSNNCGQLGFRAGIKETTVPKELIIPDIICKSVSCGANHTIILTMDNKLYSFGSNKEGQLGLGDYRMRDERSQISFTFPLIKSVRCGSYHTIVTTLIGDIYVWGRNEEGQLGLGDNVTRNLPTKLKFI